MVKKNWGSSHYIDILKLKNKAQLERYYFSKGWFDRKIDYTVTLWATSVQL